MFLSQFLALIRVGNYRAVTTWKPWSAAIMVAVIIILSSIISVSLTNLLAGTGSGPGQSAAAGQFGTKELGVVLLMQVAMVALTWIAASAGTIPARDVLALRSLGPGPRTYILAIVVMFAGLAAYNAIVWLFAYDQWQADLFKYRDVIFSSRWGVFAIIVVVGAPLSEEMLFRGFLIPAIGQSRLGVMGAALVSSIGWAMLHWDYSTSGLIEIFLIGLYFSALLWITGSLWVGMVCHGVYNLVLLLVLRLFAGGA